MFMSQSTLDDTPLDLFYQKYWLAVLNYIRQRISGEEDAEDLLLEVFLAALENEELLVPFSEQQQLAWLRRTAHNKCVDHHRRAVRRPAIPLDQAQDLLYEREEFAPEQIVTRREEFALLRTQISLLSELQQEALHLRFAYDLPYAEIARRMQRKEGSVRTLLSRALSRLRSIYERRPEEIHHG